MMRHLTIFILSFLSYTSFAQNSQPFDFRKLTSYALQGDVKKILNVLDTLPDEILSPEQKEIKNKYYRRFKFEDETIGPSPNDALLHELLNIYQAYWKKVLLDNGNLINHDKKLGDSIAGFLHHHGYGMDTLPEQALVKNFGRHLQQFLQQRHYFSATGKTGKFFDLLIWTREVPVVYTEVLPETKIKTTVVFIENTLTMGWEEYATFGKAYPGGWATKEKLYCVRKAYDTTSENFKISYLKHEAQHFADYKDYPVLTGADLEYRAKLTELIFARQTLYNIMGTFIRNASQEGRNSHAFANYTVIKNLSKILFYKDFVADTDQWKSIPPKKINKKSKKLLYQHSRALRKAGANKITELIK